MSQTPQQQHLASQLQGGLPYSAPGSPISAARCIGCIGLGNIGGSIAKNLAIHFSRSQHHAKHSIVLWNRTRAKADQIVAEVEAKTEKDGGIASVSVANSVEDLVKECDIILTSLSNDAAVTDMYEIIIKTLKEDRPTTSGNVHKKIVVDTSTIYPTLTGQLDTRVSAIPHTTFVAAPVFGATAVAANAQLVICLAGDYRSKKEIAYLLVPAAGKKVIDLGGNVEKAVAFKLVGNSHIVSSIELLAQTHTLADKVGLSRQTLHNFLAEMLPAPPLIKYSERLLNDDFDGNTGFNINSGLKDVHHIQRLSAEYNCPVPFLDTTGRHIVTARALNAARPENERNPNMDWSAMVSASRVAAGLDPFNSKNRTAGLVVPEVEE
ncbi:hypothetical protein FRB94_009372 [Tulasnella sp. JGI-2019a]|nr:hypothetical protein FRB94_009372 [Tulasnella sp. JGI-2019a]KAG9026233.1 hypothetical protein FRB95_009071 [Tulasnella sp. JGI-2019a]